MRYRKPHAEVARLAPFEPESCAAQPAPVRPRDKRVFVDFHFAAVDESARLPCPGKRCEVECIPQLCARGVAAVAGRLALRIRANAAGAAEEHLLGRVEVLAGLLREE